MRATKSSPGTQSHTSNSTLYPACCSCQASHSAQAVSRPAWLMKKSTPRPLTHHAYTAQPPYAIPGTAQQRHPSVGPNGTPLRRYRRGKVLVVICHAAPGCSRTRRGDDRHDRVEPAVDSSATGAGSTRPHADQPAGAGGGGPGGAGPGAALRRRLASALATNVAGGLMLVHGRT